jgi:hypothetical protein
MPLLPPVTNTDLPSKRFMTISFALDEHKKATAPAALPRK